MGPQRLGTVGTEFVVFEVQPLDGREVDQVGPQVFGTILATLVAA